MWLPLRRASRAATVCCLSVRARNRARGSGGTGCMANGGRDEFGQRTSDVRFSPVLCPMSLEFPPYRSNYRSSAASLADHLEDTITSRTFPLLMVRLPSVRTQNAVARQVAAARRAR